MIKVSSLLMGVLTIQLTVIPAVAAESLPGTGVFTEPTSESELNFGKGYLGFPEEECTFKSPKKLKAGTWRITTTCKTADPAKITVSKAILEKRGKVWRLTRGEFVLDFAR